MPEARNCFQITKEYVMSGKFKKVILLSLFWALTSVSNAANLVVGRWLDDLGYPAIRSSRRSSGI